MQVFGSFATGLFLPTSDMDLVVTGSECGNVAQGLRALAQAFTRKGLVKNVQARAPLCPSLLFLPEASLPHHFRSCTRNCSFPWKVILRRD